MANSEGARHLVAFMVVAAAVGTQSVVTQGLAPAQYHQADFGVKLLAAELEIPSSTVDRNLLALPSSEEAAVGTSSTLRGTNAAPGAPELTTKRERRWFGVSMRELQPNSALPDPSLDRRKPNRDSVGSPIELTENDVLIPVRLAY